MKIFTNRIFKYSTIVNVISQGHETEGEEKKSLIYSYFYYVLTHMPLCKLQ